MNLLLYLPVPYHEQPLVQLNNARYLYRTFQKRMYFIHYNLLKQSLYCVNYRMQVPIKVLEYLALSFIIMYQNFMVKLNIITTYWFKLYCEYTCKHRVRVPKKSTCTCNFIITPFAPFELFIAKTKAKINVTC